MDDKKLDEIKKRWDLPSAGPWSAMYDPRYSYAAIDIAAGDGVGFCEIWGESKTTKEHASKLVQNAEAIGHAWQDVHDLLDEIEYLKTKLEQEETYYSEDYWGRVNYDDSY